MVLKVGMQNFLTGCQVYFHRYKWSNTTLDQFIQCQQDAYDPESTQLHTFASRWLKTKGLPSFMATLKADKIVIKQEFMQNADHVLRP